MPAAHSTRHTPRPPVHLPRQSTTRVRSIALPAQPPVRHPRNALFPAASSVAMRPGWALPARRSAKTGAPRAPVARHSLQHESLAGRAIWRVASAPCGAATRQRQSPAAQQPHQLPPAPLHASADRTRSVFCRQSRPATWPRPASYHGKRSVGTVTRPAACGCR